MYAPAFGAMVRQAAAIENQAKRVRHRVEATSELCQRDVQPGGTRPPLATRADGDGTARVPSSLGASRCSSHCRPGTAQHTEGRQHPDQYDGCQVDRP